MVIILTNENIDPSAIPCEDISVAEELEARVREACRRVVEKAMTSRSSAVALRLGAVKASGIPLSYFLSVLSEALDDELETSGDECLEVIVSVSDLDSLTGNIEALEAELQKLDVVTREQSFGDYGDRLRPEFEYYTDRLFPQKCFAEYLSELIEGKRISKYSDVYRAAGISKFTFSKIMNLKKTHQPSKGTVTALAIGLKLDLEEAQKLYNAAGYYLGYSDLTDKIIRFFIEKEIYDINEVNICLLYYNLPILGEQARECKVRFKR